MGLFSAIIGLVGAILGANASKKAAEGDAARIERLGIAGRKQVEINRQYHALFDVDIKKFLLDADQANRSAAVSREKAASLTTKSSYENFFADISLAQGRLKQQGLDVAEDNVRATAALDRIALKQYGYDALKVLDAQRVFLSSGADKDAKARIERYSTSSELSASRYSSKMAGFELTAARQAAFEQRSRVNAAIGQQRTSLAGGNVSIGSQSAQDVAASEARQGVAQIERIVEAGLLQSEQHSIASKRQAFNAVSTYESSLRSSAQGDLARYQSKAKGRDIGELAVKYKVDSGKIDTREDTQIASIGIAKTEEAYKTRVDVDRRKIQANDLRLAAYEKDVGAVLLDQQAGWALFSGDVQRFRKELASLQEQLHEENADDYAAQARDVRSAGKAEYTARLASGGLNAVANLFK